MSDHSAPAATATPAKRRLDDASMVPSSIGKNPPARVADPSRMRRPSTEDGQKKANEFLNVDPIVDWRTDVGDNLGSLYVSANSFALNLVRNLECIVRNKEIDRKYIDASEAFVRKRTFLRINLLQRKELGINERYFTGLFAQALNSVLDRGMVVNHLECIGEGTTHSDVSGRCFRGVQPKPILMVGEGKLGDDNTIRTDVRCQLANEFIRHRGIDKIRGIEDFAPVLLVALNYSFISLELAFPSTKGGSMEKNRWVIFKNCEEGMETFWTVPIAFVQVSGNNTSFKLPRVFQFINDTLWELQKVKECGGVTRVQFKTPWISDPHWFHETSEVESKKCGDNVTILSSPERKYVYKEFCYYLRSNDDFNYLQDYDKVDPVNQRRPPDRALLAALGQPYQSWHVTDGPFGIKILSYEYLDGDNRPEKKDAWVQVLSQIQIMHSKDWVHGDLLPRNLVFCGKNGYVIDFDLSRKVKGLYVAGYEYEAFKMYRHPDARPREPMEKKHDVWAMVKLSEEFFVLPENWADVHTAECSDLKDWFMSNEAETRNPGVDWTVAEATGSPQQR